MVGRLYFVVGVAMILVGLYSRTVKRLYTKKFTTYSLICVGIITVVSGVLLRGASIESVVTGLVVAVAIMICMACIDKVKVHNCIMRLKKVVSNIQVTMGDCFNSELLDEITKLFNFEFMEEKYWCYNKLLKVLESMEIPKRCDSTAESYTERCKRYEYQVKRDVLEVGKELKRKVC